VGYTINPERLTRAAYKLAEEFRGEYWFGEAGLVCGVTKNRGRLYLHVSRYAPEDIRGLTEYEGLPLKVVVIQPPAPAGGSAAAPAPGPRRGRRDAPR
jgi:hypothetical protein